MERGVIFRAWGEMEFNIKSNLKEKLSVRQAVLYTFSQDCSWYGDKMLIRISQIGESNGL